MRLGIKIFCCVTVFFSAAFLCGGYILLSCFYEAVMAREIDSAMEQYQYNKFVLQAALITRGSEWFEGVAEGKYAVGAVAKDMSHTVALCGEDGEVLYSAFPAEADVAGLLTTAERDSVCYRFLDLAGRKYILASGMVAEGDSAVYLLTGKDIGKVVKQQEEMQEKFGVIYAAAISISVVLIFGLSALLARPIGRLTEATKSIADGNYGERIQHTGGDEVGQLAMHFNRMASAVEEKVGELIQNARQQEDFVANFAHELKTPLTSIIGYSNRIYRKELSREEQKKAAFYIWNEGMRLESLSHKLMDLTNLNRGEFVLQEARTDTLLRELVADAAYLAEEKGIALTADAEEAVVRVEYDLFKSLFLNLVDNAVKAGADCIQVTGKLCKKRLGQDGERSGSLPVAERAYSGGNHIYCIQVADNGSGIPQEELSRITESFYMVDKSRSRKQHGAGIGLALAKRIADIHGGSLHFESRLGQGTRVSVELLCAAKTGEEGGGADE